MSALRVRLGRVLRRHREARALTQEQLADATGLHRNYVGLLERGQETVSVDALDRIVAALAVPLGAFFTEVDAELNDTDGER